ncbi:MAG TPA: hypothetical protein VFT99_20525, partial [Roseiflexaceae bacterium]|nr:hypothetical protein [Roseiflexaceae bacterium]
VWLAWVMVLAPRFLVWRGARMVARFLRLALVYGKSAYTMPAAVPASAMLEIRSGSKQSEQRTARSPGALF